MTQVDSRKSGWLARVFGLSGPVDRRTYALVGFGLMLAKYAIDALAVYAATGAMWTPIDYLSPLLITRQRKLGTSTDAFQLALLIWTLPFLWIGLSMTMRRTYDAGFNAWSGLILYFVPFLNYAWMLLLCVLPTVERSRREAQEPPRASLTQRAALAVLIALMATTALFALSVYALRSYGSMLFVGAPVLLGALSSFLYNRGDVRPWKEALGISVLSVFMTSGAMLLFAAEGVICIAMAAPIALVMAMFGAVVGRAVADFGEHGFGPAALLPVAFGGATWLEARLDEPACFAVTTSIEIDAPRERVWRHVVSFCEIPEPSGWLFHTGLAYPVRASIAGCGVGALRRCEFSTGAFVEPITAWEEPERLSFDVIDEPPPMHEWSPYRALHPPHLDGYFSSRRGEFRLVDLGGGRTRLAGTTWYELRFAPASYWRLWSDFVVHAVHARVLEHVAELARAH